MRLTTGLIGVLVLATDHGFCKPLAQVADLNATKPKATPCHGPHTADVPHTTIPRADIRPDWSYNAAKVARTVAMAPVFVATGSGPAPSPIFPLVVSRPFQLLHTRSIASSANRSMSKNTMFLGHGPVKGLTTLQPKFSQVFGSNGTALLTTLPHRQTPRPDYNCKAPYDIGWPAYSQDSTCINYLKVETETSQVNCNGCPLARSTSKPSNTAMPPFVASLA